MKTLTYPCLIDIWVENEVNVRGLIYMSVIFYFPFLVYLLYSVKVYFEIVKFQITYNESIITKCQQIIYLTLMPSGVIILHLIDIIINIIELINSDFSFNIYLFQIFFFVLNLMYLTYTVFFRFISKIFYKHCFLSEIKSSLLDNRNDESYTDSV